MAKVARIRFSGVVVALKQRSDVWIAFPKSQPVSSPLHEPVLSLRDMDRKKSNTKVARLCHGVTADSFGDSTLQIPLLGEDQLWRSRARQVEVLVDGARPRGKVLADPSVSKIYDLRTSGITVLHPLRHKSWAASLRLSGGGIKADRRVAGIWRVGPKMEEVELFDALEWTLEYRRDVTVVLKGRQPASDKKIVLNRADGADLRIGLTSFSKWYDEDHKPSYKVLEEVAKLPRKAKAKKGWEPECCFRFPWPEKVKAQSPGVYCPFARFGSIR